jgi:hypothetical protein
MTIKQRRPKHQPGKGGGNQKPVGGGGHPKPVGGGGGGGGGALFTDVNALPTVSSAVASEIKAAAMAVSAAHVLSQALTASLKFVATPGTERWPVKTGTDADTALVGNNIINGKNLGVGIVDTTVDELIGFPRAAPYADPGTLGPQSNRMQPVETTVWRIEVTITSVKQESDGDFHLVVIGPSGAHMIAEVPMPTTQFLGNSPWIDNIRVTRQMVDQKFVQQLSPANFVEMGNTLVPRASVSPEVQAMRVPRAAQLPSSFVAPAEGQVATIPTFKTQVTPTRARITGVGFFDKVHGQTGVALTNAIEIHPVLKIEWL